MSELPPTPQEPYVRVIGWLRHSPIIQCTPEQFGDMRIHDMFEEQADAGRMLYVYLPLGRQLMLTGDLPQFYDRNQVGQQLEAGIIDIQTPNIPLPPEWEGRMIEDEF